MAVSPGWQHARARLFVPAPHLFQLVGGDVVEVAPAVLILLVEPVVARFALILGACDKRDHPYHQREQDTRQRDPQESPDLIRHKIFPSRAPGVRGVSSLSARNPEHALALVYFEPGRGGLKSA